MPGCVWPRLQTVSKFCFTLSFQPGVHSSIPSPVSQFFHILPPALWLCLHSWRGTWPSPDDEDKRSLWYNKMLLWHAVLWLYVSMQTLQTKWAMCHCLIAELTRCSITGVNSQYRGRSPMSKVTSSVVLALAQEWCEKSHLYFWIPTGV